VRASVGDAAGVAGGLGTGPGTTSDSFLAIAQDFCRDFPAKKKSDVVRPPANKTPLRDAPARGDDASPQHARRCWPGAERWSRCWLSARGFAFRETSSGSPTSGVPGPVGKALTRSTRRRCCTGRSERARVCLATCGSGFWRCTTAEYRQTATWSSPVSAIAISTGTSVTAWTNCGQWWRPLPCHRGSGDDPGLPTPQSNAASDRNARDLRRSSVVVRGPASKSESAERPPLARRPGRRSCGRAGYPSRECDR